MQGEDICNDKENTLIILSAKSDNNKKLIRSDIIRTFISVYDTVSLSL